MCVREYNIANACMSVSAWKERCQGLLRMDGRCRGFMRRLCKGELGAKREVGEWAEEVISNE